MVSRPYLDVDEVADTAPSDTETLGEMYHGGITLASTLFLRLLPYEPVKAL